MSQKLATLAKQLAELRERKTALEEALKSVNADITKLSTKTIPGIMEDQEIEKLKVSGVGTLYVQQRVYVQVDKADQEKAYTWLRENGHGGLIVEYVHPKTLQAFAAEQTENGKPLPDTIKTTFIPTAAIRKA